MSAVRKSRVIADIAAVQKDWTRAKIYAVGLAACILDDQIDSRITLDEVIEVLIEQGVVKRAQTGRKRDDLL